MIEVKLPYPNKALWPNGRSHYMAKAREVKKHRSWAFAASKAELGDVVMAPARDGKIGVEICVVPKRKGPFPDRDNVVSAAKAYLDGIAQAIGVNDRNFSEPRVSFYGREDDGAFIIRVGG